MKTVKIDTKGLGLTETNNFNRNYKTESRFVEAIEVKQNPKNKRVYFVKLVKSDLESLINSFSSEKICDADIQNNQFAVYNYQIID